MKNKYFLLLFIVVVQSHISCKKSFLEAPPGNFIPAETYVSDLNSSQEYLNGIYAQLSSNLYYGTNIIYPDVIADDVKPIVGGSLLARHYSWTQQSDEGSGTTTSTFNMNNMSLAGYKIIGACNFLLEKADVLKKENSVKADEIIGQVYAIRGLVHWMLLNIFAQPYNFTENGEHLGIVYATSSDWKKISRKRFSVSEVYEKILEDLGNGIARLPEKSVTSVINSLSVKALMARIYLAMEDFNSARSMAIAVISKKPLMIAGYPEKLFTLDDTEALFQLVPSERGVSNTFPSTFFRSPLSFVASEDIAIILQESETDLRRKWVSKTAANWNIVKFPVGAVNGITFANPARAYYPDVIRSSEMYLILAESYARSKVHPKEDSARHFINIIRRRANPQSAFIVASGNSLLDSIYKERRKELSFEGYRMFDLLRWEKAVVRNQIYGSNITSLPYPSNLAIAPIPLQDIRAGVEQNPSY